MKFSPLFLFIALLIVLLVIVVFSKFRRSKEGFIGFNNNQDAQEYIKIYKYSRTSNVTKILDNIYFDAKNGNMIEVDGPVQVSNEQNGNAAVAGETTEQRNIREQNSLVTKVYVTTRSNTKYTYDTVRDANTNEENQKVSNSITSTASSTDPFEFLTNTTTTDKYQVIYLPFGIHTIILILNITQRKIQFMYAYFYGNMNGVPELHNYNIAHIMETSSNNDDSNDGKDVIVETYNNTKKVYQLSKNVWIDRTNGYYIVDTFQGKKIFDADAVASGQPRQTFRQPELPKCVVIVDKNKNPIIYASMRNFIGLYVLKWDATSGKFIFDKKLTLDMNVASNQASSSPSAPSTPSAPSVPSGNAPPTDNLGPYSDYYRWLAYWNSTGKTGIFSQDYIEKTQIVPPVCPACPSCPSSGVCTNCGGNGGSGSTGVNPPPPTNAPGPVASIANTAGNTVTSVASTTADVLKSTGSGTADLLKSAGSGTTDLLKSTGSGAANLLRSAGSGTYDFITGKWLDSDGNEQPANGRTPPQPVSSGSSGRSSNYQYRDGGGQGAGRMGGPDNYNYNGALTEKGGNFIPLTADFSAFGR